MLGNLMEDYALKCDRKLLVKCHPSSEGAANPSMMSLQGRRVGYCEEFDENEQIADERIKALTGGGQVRACQLNHPEVQFEMTCGFVLASNKKPQFESVDQAIKRRIVMVPCDTMYRDDTTEIKYDPMNPKHRWRDPNIVAKLNTDEGKRQLLVWLAKGAFDFYSANSTLPPLPPSISAIGRQLQQEQDLLGTFVEQCCEVDPDFDKANVDAYCKSSKQKQTGSSNKQTDPRFLYMRSDFHSDFYELHNVEFTKLHEKRLLGNHGVGLRKLRAGYHKPAMYFVGIRPASEADDVDDQYQGREEEVLLL